MRSAADSEDVGWPEPASVLHRIESTRSWRASWRTVSNVSVIVHRHVPAYGAQERAENGMISTSAASAAGWRPASSASSSALVMGRASMT